LKIVFDQGVPVPLRSRLLVGHEVYTAYELTWSTLKNGELLSAADKAGYDLLVTTDQKLKYQQNLVGRSLSIVVLLSTSWPRIEKQVDAILAAISRAGAGSYEEVPIP
jgi:hypothetical protein